MHMAHAPTSEFTLRVQRRGATLRGLDAPEVSRDTQFDNYLGRLLKLIPAEVVAFYLVGKGVLPSERPLPWAVWTFVCIAAVIGVRAPLTREPVEGGRPQWLAVIIA